MGALTVLCQISYTTALSVGPLSLTGLVYNLAMPVPIFVSKLRYDEPLSAMRVIGILLSVAALIINTKPSSGGKIPKKWYLFALLAFAFNGLVATLLVTVSGIALFKEKLSRRQWVGVTTGAIAIVFLLYPLYRQSVVKNVATTIYFSKLIFPFSSTRIKSIVVLSFANFGSLFHNPLYC